MYEINKTNVVYRQVAAEMTEHNMHVLLHSSSMCISVNWFRGSVDPDVPLLGLNSPRTYRGRKSPPLKTVKV